MGDHGLVRFFLVGFEREEVVGCLVHDEFGDVGMAAHRVDADGGSVELEFAQQPGQGFEFVAFFSADFVADTQVGLADPGS